MATSEDVVLKVGAQNNTGSVLNSITQTMGSLGIVGYNAITNLSSQFKAFGNEATQIAKTAETSWIAFNNSLNKSGAGSSAMASSMKNEVIDMANNMGVSVGSARDSFTELNNRIKNTDQAMKGVQASQALATATGQDLASTTSMINTAMSGRGMALKKLGIDIDQYKNKETGAINTDKLFNDIINQNKQALTQYGQSATATGQRLDNAWLAMETSIGQSMLGVKQVTSPILTSILTGLNDVNKATGGVAYGFVGLGVSAMGTLGDMANVTLTITNLITLQRELRTAMEGVTIIETLQEAITTKLGFSYGVLGTNMTASGLSTATAEGAFGALFVTEESLAVGTDLLSFSFMGLSFTIAPMVVTILAIVGAIALLIVAFEKVGEYFGWWTDFGTMLDSIQAGVTRLWNAFMNSPQVQGTINDISNALKTIGNIINPVINAVKEFFGIPEGAGNWADPVGDIINAFGQLGKICGDVVNWIKNIPNNLAQLPIKANQFIMRTVQYFIMLPLRIAMYLNMVVMRIINWGLSLATGARNAGTKLITGFINRIATLPSQALKILLRVVTAILTMGARAVSSAGQVASNIVTGFKNSLHGIADYVYNEFASIPGKITSCISGAVSAVTNFGTSVWDAFKSAIGANSPSMFYKQIAWDFEDIPKAINSQQGRGVRAVSDYGSALMKGFNYQNLNTDVGLNLNAQQLGNINRIGGAGGVTNTHTNNNASTLIVNIHEGAFQLDTRNFTVKESKQLLVNAIEGLEVIESVNVRGA